jgi:hypothetical protein
MFILIGIIGALIGTLYAYLIVPILLETKKDVSANTSDGQLWFIILPGACASMLLTELYFEETRGVKFESYTGLWEFMDLFPDLIFTIIIILFSVFIIFFLFFYILLPFIFIIGYVMLKLGFGIKK